MNFTINCTRVPIPQGTTLYGIPVEVGLAPATLGSVSTHDAPPSESYDGSALNPIGRAAPDRKETVPTKLSNKPLSQCIVNYKQNTIISTLNSRTLLPLGSLEEIANNAMSQCIDVIAIQEHRFYHPGTPINYRKINKYQLITSSASKNTANSSVGGVGFLLSSKASDNLLSVEPISPRITVIELVGNPKTTIISVYSPHNGTPLDEVEDFYRILSETVEQVPLHNFLMITGDFNAKLGPQDVRFTFNDDTKS